eukprot:c6766_g1_i1.p1 GENE.c6766_g1_i1~~c6766_g1_i1.p1  ORF type:complete len:882 (-),score=272.34 c6766_g1_i1:984-3578(-)
MDGSAMRMNLVSKSTSDEWIATIVSMGFEIAAARLAIQNTNWRGVDAAVDYLLSNPVMTQPEIIRSDTSVSSNIYSQPPIATWTPATSSTIPQNQPLTSATQTSEPSQTISASQTFTTAHDAQAAREREQRLEALRIAKQQDELRKQRARQAFEEDRQSRGGSVPKTAPIDEAELQRRRVEELRKEKAQKEIEKKRLLEEVEKEKQERAKQRQATTSTPVEQVPLPNPKVMASFSNINLRLLDGTLMQKRFEPSAPLSEVRQWMIREAKAAADNRILSNLIKTPESQPFQGGIRRVQEEEEDHAVRETIASAQQVYRQQTLALVEEARKLRESTRNEDDSSNSLFGVKWDDVVLATPFPRTILDSSPSDLSKSLEQLSLVGNVSLVVLKRNQEPSQAVESSPAPLPTPTPTHPQERSRPGLRLLDRLERTPNESTVIASETDIAPMVDIEPPRPTEVQKDPEERLRFLKAVEARQQTQNTVETPKTEAPQPQPQAVSPQPVSPTITRDEEKRKRSEMALARRLGLGPQTGEPVVREDVLHTQQQQQHSPVHTQHASQSSPRPSSSPTPQPQPSGSKNVPLSHLKPEVAQNLAQLREKQKEKEMALALERHRMENEKREHSRDAEERSLLHASTPAHQPVVTTPEDASVASLRIRLPDGSVVRQTYPKTTSLRVVLGDVATNHLPFLQDVTYVLFLPCPPHVFTETELDQLTLSACDLVPRGVLCIQRSDQQGVLHHNQSLQRPTRWYPISSEDDGSDDDDDDAENPHGYIDPDSMSYDQLLELQNRIGHVARETPAHVLRGLQHAVLNNEDCKLLEKENCVVCMCGFAAGESMTTLRCSHKFHSDCISKWLRASKECCVCREPV